MTAKTRTHLSSISSFTQLHRCASRLIVPSHADLARQLDCMVRHVFYHYWPCRPWTLFSPDPTASVFHLFAALNETKTKTKPKTKTRTKVKIKIKIQIQIRLKIIITAITRTKPKTKIQSEHENENSNNNIK